MANVYIARMLTREGAERFEEFMKTKNNSIQIGPNVNVDELALTDVSINPVVRDDMLEIFRQGIMKNKEQTEKVHSFCFVADNLEEAVEALKICAYQPTSEGAISRIDRGSFDAEDCFARDRVSAFVIEMDEDKFKKYCDIGIIGTGMGKYDYQGGVEQLAEVIVGDRAIKDAIKNTNTPSEYDNSSRVVIYDELHRVFLGAGVSFDSEGIFDYGYEPEVVINPEMARTKREDDFEYDRTPRRRDYDYGDDNAGFRDADGNLIGGNGYGSSSWGGYDDGSDGYGDGMW